MSVEAVLAFTFGLLIGSFLNVCIYRMARDLSVIRPRSFCPSCGRTINWYDNIPLASYAALGGRCRQCKAPISIRYPVVELVTGGAFAAAVIHYGLSLAALKLSIFSALLIGLIFADLEERILPDEFTIAGVAAGVLLALVVPMPDGLGRLLLPGSWGPRLLSAAESVLGAVITSGSIWLVGEIYYKLRHKEGLGFGDVKMVAMIGAFLGIHMTFLTLIVGSLAGSVLGLAFILITRKEAATYELPFGSFLGGAALVVAHLSAPALGVRG